MPEHKEGSESPVKSSIVPTDLRVFMEVSPINFFTIAPHASPTNSAPAAIPLQTAHYNALHLHNTITD